MSEPAALPLHSLAYASARTDEPGFETRALRQIGAAILIATLAAYVFNVGTFFYTWIVLGGGQIRFWSKVWAAAEAPVILLVMTYALLATLRHAPSVHPAALRRTLRCWLAVIALQLISPSLVRLVLILAAADHPRELPLPLLYLVLGLPAAIGTSCIVPLLLRRLRADWVRPLCGLIIAGAGAAVAYELITAAYNYGTAADWDRYLQRWMRFDLREWRPAFMLGIVIVALLANAWPERPLWSLATSVLAIVVFALSVYAAWDGTTNRNGVIYFIIVHSGNAIAMLPAPMVLGWLAVHALTRRAVAGTDTRSAEGVEEA